MEHIIRVFRKTKEILGLIGVPLLFILTSCGGNDNYDEIGIPAREDRGGDFGYVNLDGDIIVDFTIDKQPSIMTEGIGFYLDYDQSDKSYFVTYVKPENDGEEFKTRYTQSLSFNEGLALVTTETGKLTYINKDYEEVLVLDDAEEAGYFVQGLAKYKSTNGKWGFKDKEGVTIINPQYDYVESFNEGYAMVRNRIEGEDLRGIIDRDGNEVIPLDNKYERLGGVFDGLISYKDDNEYGFLDIDGNEVIKDDDWDDISFFHNGYATIKESREFGVINKKGEFKIRIREDWPIILSNDKYVYIKNRDFGYKDINQDVVISAEYDEALPFFDKNGAWVKDNKDWVYIDDDGKQVSDIELYDIDLSFDHMEKMACGLPPLDLEETIESNFVNIEGFISGIVNFDSRLSRKEIFGIVIGESTPNDVINSINSSPFPPHALDIESEVINQSSRSSTRISTKDIVGWVEFDRSFSYDIRYYFDNKILEKSEGLDYDISTNCVVNRIRFQVDLNNKAYGKDDQIVDRCVESLESAGYVQTDVRNEFLHRGYSYKVSVRNSSGSISLDFSIY